MLSKIKWVGWTTRNGRDNIWGYLRLNKFIYYSFIGKRGGSLKLRRYDETYSERPGNIFVYLESDVKKNGYSKISIEFLKTIWPDFENELEQLISIEVMKGNISGD